MLMRLHKPDEIAWVNESALLQVKALGLGSMDISEGESDGVGPKIREPNFHQDGDPWKKLTRSHHRG